MTNVLSFTLGLAAHPFLKGLEEASAGVKGFIGGMLSLEGIAEGVWKSIERGAGLEQLSKRTGESVENLYKLQRGFASAGLSADDVGSAIYQMNKALGGTNEMGESTVDVFSKLGLSLKGLKGESAPEQFQRITEALGHLDRASATKAAGLIFGRGEAGNMLQLSRSSEEFAAGMQRAAAQASQFQRMAELFEKIERTVGMIKEKGTEFFSGIASGVAPGIQAVADALNSIDLQKLGEDIGKYIGMIGKAFSSGHLGDFLEESLVLGLQSVIIAAPAILEKLGVILFKVFEGPLVYLQAGLEIAIDKIANNKYIRAIANIATMGAAGPAMDLAGVTSGKETSMEDILKERQQRGLEMFQEGFGLSDMESDANDRLSQAKANIQAKWGDFWKFIQDSSGGEGGGGKNVPGGKSVNFAAQYQFKPEYTSLEKMGFVMSGGGVGNPALEHARKTAENTGRMVELFEDVKDSLANRPELIHQDIG